MSVPEISAQLPLFPLEKRCRVCGFVKTVSEFRAAGKRSRSKDGLQSYCKSCCREYNRAHPPKGSVVAPAALKTCTVCKASKQNTEFRKDRTRRDGLSHRCRDCGRQLDRERWQRVSQTQEPTTTRGRNRKLVPKGLKVCLKCKEIKPLGEFGRSTTEAYGLRGGCKTCERENQRMYYAANIHKVKAYDRARYPKVKDRMRASFKQWQANNPEKARAMWQRKRFRRRSAVGKFTAKDVRMLLKDQQGLCYYCQEPYGEHWQIDHKLPLARGGTHWPSNLCIACVPCNQRKHTSTAEEFTRMLAQGGLG